MNANQEKLNQLRAQRAELQGRIELAQEERDLAHQAVAIAVADDDAPDDWPEQSGRLDKAIEALTLGLKGIDAKIHAHIGAANLQAAKLEVRREPLGRTIAGLKEQRLVLVKSCLDALRVGGPTPAGFTKQLNAMDAEIVAKTGELEALRAAIAAVAV